MHSKNGLRILIVFVYLEFFNCATCSTSVAVCAVLKHDVDFVKTNVSMCAHTDFRWSIQATEDVTDCVQNRCSSPYQESIWLLLWHLRLYYYKCVLLYMEIEHKLIWKCLMKRWRSSTYTGRGSDTHIKTACLHTHSHTIMQVLLTWIRNIHTYTYVTHVKPGVNNDFCTFCNEMICYYLFQPSHQENMLALYIFAYHRYVENQGFSFWVGGSNTHNHNPFSKYFCFVTLT